MTKKKIFQRLCRGLSGKWSYGISGLIALALCALALLSSCNVTRTTTTKSEYWQKADTSVIIQTKTIESYDGTRK